MRDRRWPGAHGLSFALRDATPRRRISGPLLLAAMLAGLLLVPSRPAVGQPVSITKSQKLVVGFPDVVEYTIVVTNNDSIDAFDVNVDDNYDSALDVNAASISPKGTLNVAAHTISWSVGLAPLESKTLSFDASVRQYVATPACKNDFGVVNNAQISGTPESAQTLTCIARFGVQKSVSRTAASPGESLTYTVVVTNQGANKGAAPVFDHYDSRLSISSISPSAKSHSTSADTIKWISSTLLPDQSATFRFTGRLPTALSGSPSKSGTCAGKFAVTNSATVRDQSDAVTTCVPAPAGFTVTKSADRSTAAPGDEVDYAITVKNAGVTQDSTNVVDTYDRGVSVERGSITRDGVLDEGDRTITWRTTTLSPGTSTTFRYTARMPATVSGAPATTGRCAGDFPVVNSVAVTGDSDTATVCVQAEGEFDVSKTVDKASARLGDVLTYTMKVRNLGEASGATTLVDSYDKDLAVVGGSITGGGVHDAAAHTITWKTNAIAPGTTATFRFGALIPPAFTRASQASGTCAGSALVRNDAAVAGDSDEAITCVGGKRIDLEEPSTSPGGEVTASGTGCDRNAPVELFVGETRVARATADAGGRFTSSFSVPELGLGQVQVVARCGPVLRTQLEIVLASSVESGTSALAILIFFVLVAFAIRRRRFV